MAVDVRETLIGVNCAADLSRDTVCRAARRPELWVDGTGPEVDLGAELGVSRRQLRRLFSARDAAAARCRRERERAEVAGVRIVALGDADYPQRLLELELPPPVLLVLGRIPEAPAVSVVGSRAADAYGREIVDLLVPSLARTGVVIVSGLARGIDTWAHRAAVDEPAGRTVGVLGCGLDVDYPSGSAALRRSMAERGAVITEFPFGRRPDATHFPIRNRIIAALGSVCLVIQAASRSGSLITARLAAELGREVCAVPGSIFDTRSRGTNLLIRDGAAAVLDPLDVLGAMPLADRDALLDPDSTKDPEAASGDPVLDALSPGATFSAERLSADLRLPVQEVLSRLTELEIDGRVRRHGGALWSRIRHGALRP